ncbi:ribosomal silencing factor RsfS [Gottschalkia purinilytica]|uniref:Ribosomal silencing factor RsfS n=1 Tax=Gottschalkia purinilytica TaxID=1503 RepID=A0A0L0WDA8_GOTPU|nr:ribosome silencing factor [Gottschalkia purinilytica]KNF09431.1 ribosomal silencing factor RsfS [Gottschalkia purinilytica]
MAIDNKLSVIVNSADDKKGFDIKVLDISRLTTLSDYFVIISGNSQRQVMSISDEIEEKMSEQGYELLQKEGYQSGKWILLDFGDIIVHVFYKEDREFYNLERLWIDGESRNIENFIQSK